MEYIKKTVIISVFSEVPLKDSKTNEAEVFQIFFNDTVPEDPV